VAMLYLEARVISAFRFFS